MGLSCESTEGGDDNTTNVDDGSWDGTGTFVAAGKPGLGHSSYSGTGGALILVSADGGDAWSEKFSSDDFALEGIAGARIERGDSIPVMAANL